MTDTQRLTEIGRRLGNGSYYRKRTEKCPTDLVRTFLELSAHGETANGKNPEKVAEWS